MTNTIDDLASAFAKLPGIGPRQAKRFVYYLLAAPAGDRAKLAELIASLGKDVRQCPECLRFWNPTSLKLRGASGLESELCSYCSDKTREDAQLLVVEKDQDLAAVERAGTYRGRYFVLGGVLTLSGKGVIREKELVRLVERRVGEGLQEIVLALSATSEGEHTADRVRELLLPYREQVRLSTLGRGLATGSELEYSDAETLRAALSNRQES